MNQLLFDRATGITNPQTFARLTQSQLVPALQYIPNLSFDGGEREQSQILNCATRGTHARVVADTAATPDTSGDAAATTQSSKTWAHQSGVNALSIDIDDRILISGGADSSIKLWNLEERSVAGAYNFKPTAFVPRTDFTHKFGITSLNLYPFDSAAFLSSSYDHHLKLYSTETLQPSADFDLGSIIYTHAISPIASHLLVACATQAPTVRLVDLRSGSRTHSLAGHHGAVLSVRWNPNIEHILASGAADGSVRVWDVRKSSASLGVLNVEDSTGIVGFDGAGRGARSRDCGRAHQGAVNGLTWTGDGMYIVSAGHDNCVRVWDAATGANTLANFGPTLKNGHLSTLPLLVSPPSITHTRKETFFYPNEKEILMFELHEGKLLKRLRIPGPSMASVRSRNGERTVQTRITALVWKGQVDGIYASYTDGQIRAFCPRTVEDDTADKEEDEAWKAPDYAAESGKRKRQVLDDVFRDLTKQKISFG